jgi:microcystin-dependent protein
MAEFYLGEIRGIAFNFPPKGWAFCSGQVLSIQQNQALFSIMGTTYGGNGVTTFALPDLRARTPVHTGVAIALGQSGGEADHTLTIPEMPAHTHQASGASSVANDPTPVAHVWAANASQPYGTGTDATLSGAALANTGGSQPHNNLQPYLVINYVIALVGIFPSRN